MKGERGTAQYWDDSISPSPPPPPKMMGGVLCVGYSGIVDYVPIRNVECVILVVLSMYQVDMLCVVSM